MSRIRTLLTSLPKLTPFAAGVVKIGIALCCGYLLIAAAMHLLSFDPDCYLRARMLFAAAIENGAGCLLSAAIAALLCDIIEKRSQP